MGDEVTKKIEQEVKETQDRLKDRLRETEELGDMEKGLQKQTFGLKKTTEEHQEISRGVKWKMFFKYAFWVLIGLTIIFFIGNDIYKAIAKRDFGVCYLRKV